MLHLIYILAFTILAFLAVRNLIHSLIVVGMDSQRPPSRNGYRSSSEWLQGVPHPELLDESGNVVREPLLVMRSLSIQEARTQLDSLYQSSPSSSEEASEEK